MDGGFIDLQRTFPDWIECEAKLKPPELSIPASDIVTTIRSWYPKWSHFGVDGMMANFYQEPVNIGGRFRPRLALARHMMILRDLWECRPVERFARPFNGPEPNGQEPNGPVLLLPAGSTDFFSDDKSQDVSTLEEAMKARGESVFVHWFLENGHDVHTENPYAVAAAINERIALGFFS